MSEPTTFRLRLTRENSTVDGLPGTQWPPGWTSLDFDGAWVDRGFSTPEAPWEYLHVPMPSEDAAHRVRFRWDIGDAHPSGIVAGVTLDREGPNRDGAWVWVIAVRS